MHYLRPVLIGFLAAGCLFTQTPPVVDSGSSPESPWPVEKVLELKPGMTRAELSKLLASAATIKPGMTRADLEKVLTTEGGLSTRKHRTYVARDCPYFKVSVQFEPVGSPGFAEDPMDRIVSVSKPFAQYGIYD